MLKKSFLFFFTLFFSLGSLLPILPTQAQDQSDASSLPPATPVEPRLEAKIKAEEFVRVDKKAIFDATDSSLLPGIPAEYSWEFDGGARIIGKEVVQQFSKIGRHAVNLTVRQGDNSNTIGKEIFVFDKKALIIIDEKKQTEVDNLKVQAAENGVALMLLPITASEGALLSEDALVQRIKENTDYVADTDLMVFYTQSALGFQAFNQFWQGLDVATKETMRAKSFAVIVDGSLGTMFNLVYQTYKAVQPNYILLTRAEAIGPLFSIKDFSQIIETLKTRGIEYQIIDQRGEKSPVFVLSHFITYLVSQGSSTNIIYIILIVPFLAFIAAFARQVIGISTFGIYTPLIITISFFILGLWLGLATFFLAVITGYLVKFILNKFELLYLPKVALNLSLISLSFLAAVYLAVHFGSQVPLSMAIFPMLVMSTVSEKFMAAQSEEGFRGAVFGVLGTLLIVAGSYYFMAWQQFSNLLLSWPELIVAPLLALIILGKFTGLRLSEYFRFRSLFMEQQEEE